MRRSASIAVILTLISVASAPSASAIPETTVLPTGTVVSGITSVYAMAVGGGHIYLTPGTSGSTIAVMNPDGSQAGTITNVPGASGAVIVNHILYVAAFGAGKIFRFDLSADPATKLSGLSTGAMQHPRDLRYAGGNLWFTSGCNQWGARVGWMPLDGSSVHELIGTNGDWNYCTAMEGSRYAPNRIFLHSEGVHPQHLYEYAVGGATPRLVATDQWDWGSYNGERIAPLPGGDSLAMYWSGNGGSGFGSTATFSMADMTGPITTYAGQRGSDLAVTAKNGGLLAASWAGPYVWGEIMLYRFGQSDPILQYDFRDGNDAMLGMAFSKDGTSLYAATGGLDPVVFRVLDPSLQPSSVQIGTTNNTIAFGQTTTVNVHLDGGATNRDVVLLAYPQSGSAWTVVGTKTVDTNGDASFDVSPGENTTYEADYTGDASTVDSGSDTISVWVRWAITGSLEGAFAVRNGVARYYTSDQVTYALHVEPVQQPVWLHVVVQKKTAGLWNDIAGTDMQPTTSGDATAIFDAATLGTGRYRVQARTYGSNALLPGHSRWARFLIEVL